MKKLSIFLAVCFFTALSFYSTAQTQQGNVFVGGNIANLQLILSAPNTFSINVTPTVGWFTRDNFALGAYGNFSAVVEKGGGTGYTYGGGGLTRFYSGSGTGLVNHGRFFGEASIGVSALGGNRGSYAFGLFSVGAGYSYFVTPSVGLETVVHYAGDEQFNNGYYAHTINLAFGFQIYLPRKKSIAQ
jgi:hypothetical protein